MLISSTMEYAQPGSMASCSLTCSGTNFTNLKLGSLGKPSKMMKRLRQTSLMEKSSATLLIKLLRFLTYPPLLESVFLKSNLTQS